LKYNDDVREAARRRAILSGEPDPIVEAKPVLDSVQTDIWHVFQRLHRDRQTAMGPDPIKAVAIYDLCQRMGYEPEDFLEPITALDDLWTEWYGIEQENKRKLAGG